jgi:hypothetical protein
VTTTDLQQDTFVGIRAVYEDRGYGVGLLGQYFTRLNDAWGVCMELAAIRSGQQISTSEIETVSQWNLEVFQLRIESPMEITLAVVQGGGVLGVTAYSIHLLRQVLHDGEHIGLWLPRLVRSWHRGMAEVETARHERRLAARRRERQPDPIVPAKAELQVLAEKLAGLRVIEVENYRSRRSAR